MNFSRYKFPKLSRPYLLLSSLLIPGFVALPCRAQIILNRPGGERRNVANWIAVGTNPIDIRAAAIRDKRLAAAIRKGCRTRRIYILVDHSSPELRALVGRKNLRVRLSTRNHQGRFGSRKLSWSFVLEVGKGAYQQWSGPLVWTKDAFGPATQFFAGSGEGLSATFAIRHRTFDRDFADAMVVHAVKRP